MTASANSHQKPNPSDTPTERPDDNGGKSLVRPEDKEYQDKQADFGDVAKQRETEEEPVNPIKTPPNEPGDDVGMVQPG